jgi:hypothetical protein
VEEAAGGWKRRGSNSGTIASDAGLQQRGGAAPVLEKGRSTSGERERAGRGTVQSSKSGAGREGERRRRTGREESGDVVVRGGGERRAVG